jgi:hypothetical protein
MLMHVQSVIAEIATTLSNVCWPPGGSPPMLTHNLKSEMAMAVPNAAIAPERITQNSAQPQRKPHIRP